MDRKAVKDYVRGELTAYAASVYVGSTYDEALPASFLEGLLAGRVPVIWLNENDWKLLERRRPADRAGRPAVRRARS